jgi:hypothetical protein
MPGKPVTDIERPFFLCAKSCENTIWGIMNYVNDPHPDQTRSREKPTEVGKDQVDVLRYPAMDPPWHVDWHKYLPGAIAARRDALTARRLTARY